MAERNTEANSGALDAAGREIEKILSEVDDTTLSENDWNMVVIETKSISYKWEDLVIYLGMPFDIIDNTICPASNPWNEALKQWIKHNHNTTSFGLPSWRTLLKAVAQVDKLLCKKLANKHKAGAHTPAATAKKPTASATREEMATKTPLSIHTASATAEEKATKTPLSVSEKPTTSATTEEKATKTPLSTATASATREELATKTLLSTTTASGCAIREEKATKTPLSTTKKSAASATREEVATKTPLPTAEEPTASAREEVATTASLSTAEKPTLATAGATREVATYTPLSTAKNPTVSATRKEVATKTPLPTGGPVSIYVPSLFTDKIKALSQSMQGWMSGNNSVNMLVAGKTATGKSSLINGIIGSDVAKGDGLCTVTTEVQAFFFKYHDVGITIWDSPGLQDGLDREAEYIKDMQAKGCANSDLVLYCVKMDDSRFRKEDIDAIRKLTKGLGKHIWENAAFVMTFANRVQRYPKRGEKLTPDEVRKRDRDYFKELLQIWRTKLVEAVIRAGVDEKTAAGIPIVPAGYEEEEALPDRDNWLSPLWYVCLSRMKEHSQTACLKANLHRIKLPDQITPEDFSKPTHDQCCCS